MLALETDRTRTIALHPQLVAHVMKLHIDDVGVPLGALYFTAQRVVFPMQVRHRVDVVTRLRDRPRP
jgi:hypothetical protein